MRYRNVAILLSLLTMLIAGSATAVAESTHQSRFENGSATSDRLTLAEAAQFGSMTIERVSDSLVRIRSLFGGQTQCLDADTNGGGNGTKVQVWECNNSPQQLWESLSDLRLRNQFFPWMCLDADTGGGGGNGTRVQLWDCNNDPQQRWFVFAGDLAIYNELFFNDGDTVLDRDINHVGDGAKVQLWAKNFQAQQWWQPE